MIEPETTIESPSRVRYSDLLAHGCRHLTEAGRTKGQVANYQTALNKWRALHERSADTELRYDFNRDYPGLMDKFTESCSEAISPRTMKDRLEQLEWWRQVAGQLAVEDTLPPSFSEALRIAYKKSGRTRLALCSEAGLSVESMKRWLAGKGLPERNTIPPVGEGAGTASRNARPAHAKAAARHWRQRDPPTDFVQPALEQQHSARREGRGPEVRSSCYGASQSPMD